jgi:hypothetical protein
LELDPLSAVIHSPRGKNLVNLLINTKVPGSDSLSCSFSSDEIYF